MKNSGNLTVLKEINRAAEAQKREGDTEAVLVIAEENGIDREDVEDFLDGIVPELASPLMAAMGKLQVEEADLKPEGIMKDWLSLHPDPVYGRRRNGKGRAEKGKEPEKKCIGVLLKWSFENAREINKEVAGGMQASRKMSGDARDPGYGDCKTADHGVLRIMIVYKGMRGNMTCTMGKGIYQYEVGKTYREEQSKAANTGFHWSKTRCMSCTGTGAGRQPVFYVRSRREH